MHAPCVCVFVLWYGTEGGYLACRRGVGTGRPFWAWLLGRVVACQSPQRHAAGQPPRVPTLPGLASSAL